MKLCRRDALSVLLTGAALDPRRRPAHAADLPPTYSLKGLPGIKDIVSKEAPSAELGVIGRGKNGDLTGRLNFCDKPGCISSFADPNDDYFVPPWTYDADYSEAATSAFESPLKKQLRAEREERCRAVAEGVEGAVLAEGDNCAATAAGGAGPKSRDKAFAELKKAVTEYPGATIIKASVEDRYLYAEVEDGLTGIKDDVEFLFSLNNPIVGYRSAPRVGGDAKRQKVRIRDLRKTLQESGWKSVGRAVNLAE